MRFLGLSALILVLFAGSCKRDGLPPEVAAEVQQLRNLGKAFYENPGSAENAVETLKRALDLNPSSAREKINYGLALLRAGKGDEGLAQLVEAQQQDPSIPHTWFNLGIEYKKLGEAEKAIEQLERMAELAPDLAKTQYNLGQLYKQVERDADAVAKFELAAQLDPALAAPHFQLYNMFRREDRERARTELEEFKRIKALQDETGLDEDVDWSFYSELYDPIDPGKPAAAARTVTFEAVELAQAPTGAPLGVLALDADANGSVDLLAWSDAAGFLSTGTPQGRTSVAVAALASASGVDAGDPDNDGFPDLCIVSSQRAVVVPNAAGSFGTAQNLAEGDFSACLWHDFDHDGDQDLVLFGAANKLLRYADDADTPLAGRFQAVEFPFVAGKRGLGAVAVELFEDNGVDLVIAYEGGVYVHEDRKLGRYDAGLAVDGVAVSAGATRLDAVDLDNDGFFDVAVTPAEGETVILRNDRTGRLAAGPAVDRTLAWADTQNRGWLDALTTDGVLVNQGGLDFADAASEGLTAAAFAASADFDGDGKTDVAAIGASSAILAFNRTAVDNAWARIGLAGVKSRKTAAGARVEVKAGQAYVKRQYAGYPIVVGLGSQDRIETVRVTWPNGLIQNEAEQPVNQSINYEEKPRLSGSCPMIFTWNGAEFEYISEVLGVAPLGASLGDGKFFPVDHDEYVYLTPDQLVARDGFFEVRVTEELREVAYLDQIKLIALDYPEDVEIYTNEKFKAPPFPEFQLFAVRENDKVRPTQAVDHEGRNVLNRVWSRDGRYVDGFRRTFRNTAEAHSLTLDLTGLQGDSNSKLFLHGWVDWAAASEIVAGAQTRSAATQMPVLQVRDDSGEWRTVISDLGLPGGSARTMVVDLTGKFLSDSREVRILTNMCVYWDEIYAADGVVSPQAQRHELSPADAELRFRGFSANLIHPERLEPEGFDYAEVRPVSSWDPTPGHYTRFGDVRPLLDEIDDMMVIMGAGDELALRFRAADAPPSPEGMKRAYLLFFDGWAKEHEANTAFGDTVEPLPFHQMSGYPYAADETFPAADKYRRYLQQYVKRPALRLNRPLYQR